MKLFERVVKTQSILISPEDLDRQEKGFLSFHHGAYRFAKDQNELLDLGCKEISEAIALITDPELLEAGLEGHTQLLFVRIYAQMKHDGSIVLDAPARDIRKSVEAYEVLDLEGRTVLPLHCADHYLVLNQRTGTMYTTPDPDLSALGEEAEAAPPIAPFAANPEGEDPPVVFVDEIQESQPDPAPAPEPEKGKEEAEAAPKKSMGKAPGSNKK